MSNPDEQAFLKAIASEPEEDTSRLVFADFLDDRGDPEMATFIRAEVQLARIPEADPHYPTLLAQARRSGILTRSERRPWLDSVPDGWVTFRRGLIAGVTLEPVDHLGHSVTAWERVPIEQLAWRTRSGDTSHWGQHLGTNLAARPELERLNTLVTMGGSAFLSPLLSDCPRLARLQALSIGDWPYGDTSASRITVAEQMNLPALDSLRIRTSHSGEELPAFVRAQRRPLRRLHFEVWSGSYDWLGEDATSWFGEVANWPLALGVVWHDRSDLHSDGLSDRMWSVGDPHTAERAVLTNPRVPSDRLNLSEWYSLRRLQVEGVNAYGGGIGDLAHLECAAQLSWFCSDAIHGDDSVLFSTGTQLKNLRRLSLLTSDVEILAGEYCPRLHRLDWGDPYREIDMTALLSSQLSELRWLTLRGCRNADTLAPLPTATNMPNLCTLVLEDAHQNTTALLSRLACAPGLPHLSLVGVSGSYGRQWWVLGSGKATQVQPNVDPVWSDWWEFDPTEKWR